MALEQLLVESGALDPDAVGLGPEELQSLDAEPAVEGSYILHWMASAIHGRPARLTLKATARYVELESEGGPTLPVPLFQESLEDLLQAPLRRPLRHLVLGLAGVLRQGAAEVEIASGTQRVFLTPRGSTTGEGNRPASGFLLRASWLTRQRCPEPYHVFDRCALSPVPIKVNGSLVNPALDVGSCTLSLELKGAHPVHVDSQPVCSTSEPGERFWGWVLLGGDWSDQERPRSRVYFVVDGLSYPLDSPELGCDDLRAVIHAPELPVRLDLADLVHEHLELKSTLARLTRHVERAKLTLAATFPAESGPPCSPAALTLLRRVVLEARARGHSRQALQLSQRLASSGPVFRPLSAALAARLAQYPLARELARQCEESPEHLAMVWLECGQLTQAEQCLSRAERLDPPTPAQHERKSAILLAQGRWAEADRAAGEGASLALERDEASLPGALLARARASLAQDRLVEAARLANQAAELLTREPSQLALARSHQALIHYLAGELAEADDRSSEAAARFRLRWGAQHPELAGALFLRGLVLAGMRETGKAGIVLTHSLEILTSLLGPEHPDTAAVHSALAVVRRRQGDLERAADHARQAREIYSQRWGVAHPAVARVLDRSARIAQARGLLRGAEEDAREAVRILSFSLRQSEPLNAFPDHLGTVAYHWWGPQEEGPGLPLLQIPPARLGKELYPLLWALVNLARLLRSTGKQTEASTVVSRLRELRACRGTAALALAPEGPMRRSPQGFTVLLRLQAPGRVLSDLYLDTWPRPVKLTAEGKVRVDEGVLVLKEPERRLLQPDSPLLCEPWGPTPVSLLLHAADPAAEGIRGQPRVITAAFREGPCLRIPVRL